MWCVRVEVGGWAGASAGGLGQPGLRPKSEVGADAPGAGVTRVRRPSRPHRIRGGREQRQFGGVVRTLVYRSCGNLDIPRGDHRVRLGPGVARGLLPAAGSSRVRLLMPVARVLALEGVAVEAV